jgi:ABC-type nitrate/sulfonate/bicarbonate transport system substrate-binding protein
MEETNLPMKRILASVVALLAVAACGGTSNNPSTSASAQPLTLTVALPWPAKPPICCMMEQAADQLGYYKKQGLTVTFAGSNGSAASIQTLVAGRADVAGAAVAAGMGAFAAGSGDVRYIGGELNADNARYPQKWLFATSKSVNQPTDLKGKTIGLSAGANPTDPGYVEFHALLQANGMSDSDVHYVVAGAADQRVQALVAGRIDATQWVTPELTYAIAKAGNTHVVTWDPVGANQYWNGCECWFTTASALKDKTKREAIQRFVNGTILMIRDLVANNATFTKAMGLFVDMSQQTPDSIAAVQGYWKTQYQANGCMNLTDMQAWMTGVYLKTTNPSAAGKVTLKQVVDPSLVKAALDKYGTDKTAAAWDPPQLTFPSGS